MEIEFRSYIQTKLNFGNSIANKQRCVSIYRVFLKRIKKTHIEKMCASLLCLISLHSPTFVSFPTCYSRFYFIKVFCSLNFWRTNQKIYSPKTFWWYFCIPTKIRSVLLTEFTFENKTHKLNFDECWWWRRLHWPVTENTIIYVKKPAGWW